MTAIHCCYSTYLPSQLNILPNDKKSRRLIFGKDAVVINNYFVRAFMPLQLVIFKFQIDDLIFSDQQRYC